MKIEKTLIWSIVLGSLIMTVLPLRAYESDFAYPCDIVQDKRIDGNDLIALSYDQGLCDPDISNIRSDLDGNDCIDENDFHLLANKFGYLVENSRPIVGAFCYYWYVSGKDNWPGVFVKPQLGYYDSRHTITTEIQNQWKVKSGLDLDIISWDGDFAYSNFIHGYEQSNVGASRQYFFLYESEMRLGSCSSIDFGSTENRTNDYEILMSDVEQIAKDEFQKPNYFHFQGKPVLMFWITSCFKGDLDEVVADIRDLVINLTGTAPFLICDELAFSGWEDQGKLQRIMLFDGVSSYGFYNPDMATLYNNQMNDDYLNAMQQSLDKWSDVIADLKNVFTDEPVRLFLPAFPGFHVASQLPPLYSTNEQFQQQLAIVAKLAAEKNASGVFITSFNEHFEDTAIEPSFERGWERIRSVRQCFGLSDTFHQAHRLSCNGPMIAISDYEISKYECPNQVGRMPYTWVNWYQAAAICSSTGDNTRLCNQNEWSDACDGTVGDGGFKYPYGNEYIPGKCNDNLYYNKIIASGSLPGCVSPFGVFDLSGNVGEFVSDAYPGDAIRKMNKGGTWFQGETKTTCSAIWKNTPDFSFADYGFRCCRSTQNTN